MSTFTLIVCIVLNNFFCTRGFELGPYAASVFHLPKSFEIASNDDIVAAYRRPRLLTDEELFPTVHIIDSDNLMEPDKVPQMTKSASLETQRLPQRRLEKKYNSERGTYFHAHEEVESTKMPVGQTVEFPISNPPPYITYDRVEDVSSNLIRNSSGSSVPHEVVGPRISTDFQTGGTYAKTSSPLAMTSNKSLESPNLLAVGSSAERAMLDNVRNKRVADYTAASASLQQDTRMSRESSESSTNSNPSSSGKSIIDRFF